jgi:geranylgeranyl diphosphate synthase type II
MSLSGKRIRPVLCLLGCALFDKDKVESAIDAALGLEIFHNFTLLHDDLMDRSDMRRNNLTVHKKWDDNTAILSGDAMQIMAYQYISKLPPDKLNKVLKKFSRTCLEVCEGQQMDMDFESRNNVSVAEYMEMIRLKTSVLLGTSIETGGIIGGAGENNEQALYRFGCNMGIFFQLQDDWLDVYGDAEKFGKQIGGDIVCNKKTFLLITATNDLPEKGKQELLTWLQKKEFDREKKIAAVKNLYEDANISKKTLKKITFYYENALEQLSNVKGSKDILDELKEFANSLIERRR